MINNVFLCLCCFGVFESKNGKICEKELARKEYCLSVNGVYYNLMDFKKYKIKPECLKCDEEFVVEARRLNEKQLKPETREKLDRRKKLLLDKVKNENKPVYENESEFIADLPHLDMVIYSLGKIVLYNDNLAVAPLQNETREAILYQGEYYNLTTGDKVKTYADDVWPGDIIGYDFISVDIGDMKDKEYREKLLRISLLMSQISNEISWTGKVFVMR